METASHIREGISDALLIVLFVLIAYRALGLFRQRFWYGLHAVATFGIFVFVAIYVIDRS